MKLKTLVAAVFLTACLVAQLMTAHTAPATASPAQVISWRSRAALPQRLSDLAAFVAGGHLITVGGQTDADASGTPVTNIYKSSVGSDGNLGGWTAGGNLPEARSGHGVLVHGNRVYVIGGRPAGSQTPVNTVRRGSVDADGNVGDWQSVSDLPTKLYNMGTASQGDFLFVAGGWDGRAARAEVYVATVLSNGSLMGWSTTTPLPRPLYALSLTSANGYLYAVGGHDGSTPYADVYRAQVNASGTLGSWQVISSLPAVRYRHATVVHGGRMLVIGGRGPQGASVATVFAAQINGDGTLSTWVTAPNLPQALERHAAVVTSGASCGDVVFTLGGRHDNQYQNVVYASGCATASQLFLPLVMREFVLQESPTPTATPTSEVSHAIRGHITQNGNSAPQVAIDLDFFDGSNWSIRTETYTDFDGNYRFENPPSLSSGQMYNVTYRNYESDDSRLWVRQSFAITAYSGGDVAGGSFDIQNIYHQSPPSGTIVSLPATFCWTTRGIPDDRYYFVLQDPSGYLDWRWHAAGTSNCYTLTALPAGYQFGVTYGWSIGVEDNAVDNYDWGLSYYYREIIFQAGGATSTPTPTRTPAPTATPTSGPSVPAAPTLNAIPNDDLDGNYTVSWNSVPNATSYSLQEDDNSGFSSPAGVYSGGSISWSASSKPCGTYYYRVQATNSSGQSGWSNTQSVIVCQSPDPIVNGNFEAGAAGWYQYSTHGWTLIGTSFPGTVTPHSGSWATWLGGDYSDISYISQLVTIPASLPYLTYWHWIASNDVCGYDFGGVVIDSTVVETYDLCTTTSTGGWVPHVVDLSAYAGQSVSMQIRSETDSTVNSNLFIDDVSLQPTAASATSVDAPDNDPTVSMTKAESGSLSQGAWGLTQPERLLGGPRTRQKQRG